jgi:hypothetical protein
MLAGIKGERGRRVLVIHPSISEWRAEIILPGGRLLDMVQVSGPDDLAPNVVEARPGRVGGNTRNERTNKHQVAVLMMEGYDFKKPPSKGTRLAVDPFIRGTA